MAKVIKEIIILLLICLVIMLLLAICFYEFIPSRKVVAEVTEYAPQEEIEELLSDDIDSEKDEVVLTYEVTSSDLNNYEITNEYVPGRINPFAAVEEEEEEVSGNNTNTNSTTNETNTTSNNSISNSTTSTNETSGFFSDGGTK